MFVITLVFGKVVRLSTWGAQWDLCSNEQVETNDYMAKTSATSARDVRCGVTTKKKERTKIEKNLCS